MQTWLAVLTAVTATARIAAADSAKPPEPVESRSPMTAAWLSGATTIGGLALAVGIEASGVYNGFDSPYRHVAAVGTAAGVTAFVVGPTLGHIYASDPWNRGLALRLGAVAVAALGSAAAYAVGDRDAQQAPGGAGFVVGMGALIAGGALYGTGLVYEVVTAPRAVRAYNRRQAATRSIGIVPMVDARRAGLAIGGSF